MSSSRALRTRSALTAVAAVATAFSLSACVGPVTDGLFGGDDESATPVTVTTTEAATPTSSTSSSSSSSSSSSAAAAAGEATSIYDVEAGDCIADETTISGSDNLITEDEVLVVDCNSPHREEVYEVAEMTETEIPADTDTDAWQDLGIDYCVDPFEAYTGESVLQSDYSYSFWHPSEGSWAQGDKEFVCLITHDEDHTGSVKS